jgi:hypothetical protein
LRKVRKAADLLGTRRLAAWQRAELIQIDGLCAYRLKVGIQERGMTLLIEIIEMY